MKTIQQMKKEALIRALVETGGDKEETARRLGISVRTVHNWLDSFRLNPDALPNLEEEKLNESA